MKNLIHILAAAAFLMLPLFTMAQDVVTVRDLNSYDEVLTDWNQVTSQKNAGKTVTFTAIVVSNPKSSGLASPSDSDQDGVIDKIGRMHVFVMDTTALSEGRDGMAMQLVSEDISFLEQRQRGDILTVTGKTSFFGGSVQFGATDIVHVGSIYDDEELEKFAVLLQPREVEISDLMIDNGDGTFQINMANYPKYNDEYVIVKDVTISNVTIADRPNWAINKDGYRTYIYDTSLRVRNDRKLGYLPGWNYRRLPGLEGGEDGLFVPPMPGSIANVSGFMIINNFNNDSFMPTGQVAFKINPMEDGVLWVEDFDTGDPVRCVNGEDCMGVPFSWPNDIEVTGVPPTISNVDYPQDLVLPTTAVKITADVASDFGTIDKVEIIYTAGGATQTEEMTNTAGDAYEFEFPLFANFTSVSFYIEATDSKGIKSRDPLSGSYDFFVADGAVNSISYFQKTGDEKTGPSPLLGTGVLATDITGLIVADNNDGVVIVQEAAQKWSGVFLELTDATKALVRGDQIHITKAEVREVQVEQAQNADIFLTQLINLEFTKLSSGNDIETVIPVVTTDEVVELTSGKELEPYEGMLVKFENVTLAQRMNFGEYMFRNQDAQKAGGVIFNEDLNAAPVGFVNISANIHKTIREDVVFNAYGFVASAFSAPKVYPRNLSDLQSASTNRFTPLLDFNLFDPADNATVTVTGDLEASWAASSDLDGDELTYEFVLYSADTLQVLGVFPSDNDSKDTEVTLKYNAVDGMLASAGLDYGESASFVWNVRVSDGLDTLNIHGPYGGYGDDFFPIYRTITLVRSLSTGIEDMNVTTPREFSLRQNYPNPFNPTTNISFALPNNARVTLEVFDMLGRKVATLIDGKQMTTGVHNVAFDASQFASGMYLYRIHAGSFTNIRKMMLIK